MQKAILALAALLACGGASAQNLILNGGFEYPGLTPKQPTLPLDDGSTYVMGWTVINDGVGERPLYVQGPYSEAIVSGNYGLVLNQGSGIRTSFRVDPGFYEVAFWLRPGDCKFCVSPAPMRVTVSGREYTIPLVSGWTHQTIQIYLTNTVNTLEFFNPSSSGDSKQFGLDDVTVTRLNGALLNFRFYPGVILDGSPGQHYEIQAATDLNAPYWETLTNIFLTNSPFIFIDMDPKHALDYPPKRRIYRALQVP